MRRTADGCPLQQCNTPPLHLQEAEDVPDSMLDSQELRDLVQTMMDTMRAAPGVGLAAPQIGVALKVSTGIRPLVACGGLPQAACCRLPAAACCSLLPCLFQPGQALATGGRPLSQRSALPCHCRLLTVPADCRLPLQVIVTEDRPEYISLLPDGLAEQQQRAPFEPLVIVNPSLTPLSSDGARYNEGCLSVPGYQALVERYASVQVQGVTPDGRPLTLQAKGWKARILQHECDHLQVGARCCCCCWLAGWGGSRCASGWFAGCRAAGLGRRG